jgi:hypothetical protein
MLTGNLEMTGRCEKGPSSTVSWTRNNMRPRTEGSVRRILVLHRQGIVAGTAGSGLTMNSIN